MSGRGEIQALEPPMKQMKIEEEGAMEAKGTTSSAQLPAARIKAEVLSPDSGLHEEKLGGEISLIPGAMPKLSRTPSSKVLVHRPAPLYLDLPDSTDAAKETFTVLPECTYANKNIGTTDPALECDCAEEWSAVERTNHACGDDSDCINRATKMECVADGCSCGKRCQNQRFLRKQYADVTVIRTEKKGFGLRANTDMAVGTFVYEYIGEVIDERNFRRRMLQYDEEGLKHFYFMSLTKGEFIDATKKGNLGRFCNHSCNPNCVVDKWVVGDKLRMGIFVSREIKAGEELVFNYNVDRYGADPQPCYCGEINCTGYIGGKTQSENATKLSHATIEALGIDDGDGWDTAVAKKPRKKKASEDDEEYINDLQPRSLEDDGVPKVMAALRQCTEKWIAVKLLGRIQQTDNERVGHRIIRMHGYETLKKTLTTWMDDYNVVQQVLDILHKLPRITRNKIQDSKIEEAVEQLKSCGDEQVEKSANELLDAWSKLEVAYRIPRMKRDPNAGAPVRTENHFERREKGRERSRSRSKSPSLIAPKGPSSTTIPSGPRGVMNAPRGPSGFFNSPRPVVRPRPFNPLPPGWFQATAENGSVYYYNSTGATQWQRPSQPASQPPPPPPKAKTDTQLLQDIISSITSNNTPTRPSASTTPQPVADDDKEKKSKSEKWRNLPPEKQEKIYEATLSPHVMSVSAHYRKKMEKEDIKRLSKEVAKKLVRGDYKSGRVKDPTAKLSSKHEKTVKNYVREFMDKAVKKKEERDRQRAARTAEGKAESPVAGPEICDIEEVEWDDDMMNIKAETSASRNTSPAGSNSELKRKREGDEDPGSPKKSRMGTDELQSAPPPPPPPPPPADDDTRVDGEYGSPAVGEQTELNGNAAIQQNGYGSPMQLATPSKNGSNQEDGKDGHDVNHGSRR